MANTYVITKGRVKPRPSGRGYKRPLTKRCFPDNLVLAEKPYGRIGQKLSLFVFLR
jgi:hypothetical protein